MSLNNYINNNQILSGTISIILGIVIYLFTRKYPQKKGSMIAENFRGYSASILFIIIGIVLILKTFF